MHKQIVDTNKYDSSIVRTIDEGDNYFDVIDEKKELYHVEYFPQLVNVLASQRCLDASRIAFIWNDC